MKKNDTHRRPFHGFHTTLVVASTFLLFLAPLAPVACDSDPPDGTVDVTVCCEDPLAGQSCPEVGDYTCLGSILYFCESVGGFGSGDNAWRPTRDCDAVSPACQCAIEGSTGFGFCSTDGTTSGACDGEEVQ